MNADAQQRITSILTQESSEVSDTERLRAVAVCAIVPTLLATTVKTKWTGFCCAKRKSAVMVKPWIWKKEAPKVVSDPEPETNVKLPVTNKEEFAWTQLGSKQKPLKIDPLIRSFLDELAEGRCPPACATVTTPQSERKEPVDAPVTEAPTTVVEPVVDQVKVDIPLPKVRDVPAVSYSFCDLIDIMLVTKDDRIRVPMITTSKATIKAGAGVTVKSNADKITLKSPATGEILKLKPVNGESIVFTSALGATKIGPAFCLPMVWDPKDVNAIISAINARTTCKYKLNGKSDVYNRYRSCSAEMLNSWFTPENIMAADATFNYEESCPKKWKLSKMYATMKGLNETYGIGVTKLQLKPETLFKMGKAPRIIQNEGPERCIMNLRVVYIIEYVIFHIVAPHMGIKNKDKKVVLDLLCKRFKRDMHPGKPVTNCVIGIDQSSFDFSCSYLPAKTVVKDGVTQVYPEAGLMKTEVDIMKKILGVISPSEAMEWTEVMMRERTSAKSVGEFRIGCRAVAQGKLKVRTRNNRKSGDRGTSVLNWIVEFLSTISTIFVRPDYIVAGIASRVGMDVMDHLIDSDKTYETVFKNADGSAIRSTFQGSFEGDDGLLRLVKEISLFLKEIEENYHQLGLDCTLECSLSDAICVIEFVGCHILVDKDGNTCYYEGRGGGAFCAMINKALVKSSWTMSDALLKDVAASSYHSRALQFQGKVRWVESYFEKLRDYWVSLGGMYRKELVDQYMGIAESTDGYLPESVQRLLLLLSTGSAVELSGDYVEFGETLTVDTRASDILTSMPCGFRKFVSNLVLGGAGPQYG